MKVIRTIAEKNIFKLVAISAISLFLLSYSASAQGQSETTPPTVVSVNPADGTSDIGTATNVSAVFSEALDPVTVDSSTFELRDGLGNLVATTVSYDAVTFTATLEPTNPLAIGTSYTATIRGGAIDPRVKDLAGNALANNYIWSFTTGTCASNPIVCENQKPGNPSSEWDLPGGTAGDLSIQGFATDISVDQGQTIDFKVDTDASDYRLDIYRLGYYGGNGARFITTVAPSATLPQNQPSCAFDSETNLVDCGNWAVSASWTVPPDATSGIYIAKLVRTDTGGASHIIFIVRDDDGGSELLFQTADTTWQAYNQYGGYSLYSGPSGHASKVSYNRPFTTRETPNEDWFFNAEYPMVRWLERNGYNVSYFTNVDADRYGTEILEHQAFLSVGHDEYWSAAQRTNVEVARDAGVHLAFFSGNEVYWKTRWENSIDGSNTPYRTLVSYKEGTLGETYCDGRCDPEPGVWTGLWRDGCEYNLDACLPENALTGQISWQDGTGAIEVPAEFADLRFWRNTSIASLSPGQTATLPFGTLGYEWDFEQYEDFYPAGRFWLSTTNLGGETHHLSLHRDDGGALIFGAGTVQWSWGLDSNHDGAGSPESSDMQQATVNLFADMGVQPATLQSNLVAATQSTDASAPVSNITYPVDGSTVLSGTPLLISSTATDTGGVVAGIEISVDGGTSWQRVNRAENWSYSWTPSVLGSTTIRSRAVDDSGNLEVFSPPITVNITDVPDLEPPTVSITNPTDGAIITGTVTVSANALDNYGVAGVQFQLDGANLGAEDTAAPYEIPWNTATSLNGVYTITAVARDAAGNTTTSSAVVVTVANPDDTTPPTVASIAPVDGAIDVATDANVTATFSEAMDPATINSSTFELRDQGGNLVAATVSYNAATFQATLDPTGPLANATSYTATLRGGAVDPRVKDLVGNALANNYIWTFTTVGELCSSSPCTIWSPTDTPAVASDPETSAIEIGVKFQSDINGYITGIRFYKGVENTGIHIGNLWTSTGQLLATATFTNESASGWQQVDFSAPVPISANTTYVASYHAEAGRYSVNENYFAVSGVNNPPLRALADGLDGGNGVYQVGPTGFPTETFNASNYWVDVAFLTNATPDTEPPTASITSPTSGQTISGTVAIDADATDNIGVVGVQFQVDGANFGSEDTAAPYSIQWNTTGFTNGQHTLTAVARDAAGNLTTSAAVPVTVDNPADTTPPTVTAVSPIDGVTNVAVDTAVTATFSEAMDPATIDGTTFELRDPSNNLVAAMVTYDAPSQTASLSPSAPLAETTAYTATIRGGATDPQVKDVAGNALANNYTWSFTTGTATGLGCPCSIWDALATPTNIAENDPNPVEVGVKFQSDVDGYISGIRFYKSVNNTGTHIGNLWTSTGQLLGSGTFVNETASGWQQVDFGAPVAISANVTYVASYHTEAGFYSQDDNYFASSGVDNAPLRALADGVAGGNGVYNYGPSAFPAMSLNAANYWVDIVFSPTSGPDTTPPVVIANAPADGSVLISPNVNTTVTFNEPMDPATINSSTFELRDGANNLVPATVTYDNGSRTATLDPTDALAYSTTFTAIVKGGSTDPRVKDASGNALASNQFWSFTTVDPPPIPPNDGPGGPILVVSSASNPFSRYYNEILRAEGFNLFLSTDISNVTPSMLDAYDVVILGEMPLTATQVTMFSDWVNAGGNLIAMRPDKQLAGLLGLADGGATLSEGYMLGRYLNPTRLRHRRRDDAIPWDRGYL